MRERPGAAGTCGLGLEGGAATGGCTECRMQDGGAHVTAVGSGYGQLAPKLRDDPRVEVRERTNARLLTPLTEPVGLVVADALYAAFPGQDEGKLTELRAHLVRRDTLAKAARKLELGEALLLGRGEDDGGGRKRPTNLPPIHEAHRGAILPLCALGAAPADRVPRDRNRCPDAGGSLARDNYPIAERTVDLQRVDVEPVEIGEG